jgi:hypothetical protein
MKKRNREEIEAIVNEFGYTILDMYTIDKCRRIVVQDNKGYKCDVRLQNLINNNGRIYFFHVGNKFTLENISLWLDENNKPFELHDINEYIGNNERLLFHCLAPECDEIFSSTWGKISFERGCPYCSGRRAGRHNNLSNLFPELAFEWNYNLNGDRPEEYTRGSDVKKYWICSICNYGENGEWFSSICSRTCGAGCPVCSGNIVSDNNRLSILYPEIASEWHPTKNGDLTPDDVSYGRENKAWWLCPEGHEYYSRISHRTYSNAGCPFCIFSTGEDKISKFLSENIESLCAIGIRKIIHQKRFDECRHKKPLPFDFGLQKENEQWILAEYYGEQHFFPVDFAGKGEEWAKSEFKRNQKRDAIKQKFCRDNNIPLLIISYKEFNRIEEILESFFFGGYDAQ